MAPAIHAISICLLHHWRATAIGSRLPYCSIGRSLPVAVLQLQSLYALLPLRLSSPPIHLSATSSTVLSRALFSAFVFEFVEAPFFSSLLGALSHF